MSELGVIIAATSLAILVLSSVGGLVWKLSRVEIGLRGEFLKEIAEIRAAHATANAALAAKLYQVEIWARDEFVRKGSFEIVIARMEKGFDTLRGDITQRLDKMTDKIDQRANAS